MKKLIAGAVSFAVVVAAGAALYFALLKPSKEGAPLPPGTPSGESDEGTVGRRPKSEDERLRKEAFDLIARPLPPQGDRSLASYTATKEKVEEAIGMIRDNYDFDAPWFELGGLRLSLKDYEGASEAWKFILEIRPGNFVALHNLGDLYAFSLGRHEEGERYLLQSIAANPENVQGYLTLATLYENEAFGKRGEIDDILLRGIAANPSDLTLHLRLASYYRDSGNPSEALRYYNRALALNPSNRAAIEAEIKALTP